MNKIKISCPCLFGLESVLKFEVASLGFSNIVVETGRVSFFGDFSDIAKANIWLRTAERVQIVLKEFNATTFDELFDNVKSIPFENYIGEKEAFPVTGYCLDSKLASITDCQSIIKKATVDRLASKYGISWFDESEAKLPINFSIRKDHVTIMLDTSGVGLHKRGYRELSVIAPMKETLAAGIIDLARIRDDSLVIDPMCGSGTIIIESAMKAYNIAPGLNRSFLFETWEIFKDNNLVEIVKDEAISKIKENINFRAYASDIDIRAVKLTIENLKKAGITEKITVERIDVKNFHYTFSEGTVIINPPYGERLLSADNGEVEDLYRTMGSVIPDNFKKYIITSNENFETYFGKKADRKRKLYNGTIECNLYMYFK